ncbi:Asp-tRNA(Asn)/Glu-tRNA(Gln) amidotransferase subunit GatB [Pinibacter aurantiacus]|uniref:Aspartyl/glutamyl-tRNA(Asn/Gln) amidotransferase subunit B n=1 Tax=Pinibacter aurantiacus TaxID=2851599 RepID=A0A9E2S766_9BACT|nr:Asp-tRNA(Asn)/Glu-tRNA(Gln) amidotransferase subunit GatB [Pinibacter aurantiacus]MBV4357101.1 Asp-tRNA(Asn)/Glu-tRNA(Gln) amidotransferase subunit GatB [Pinibacter aurantiacus]
MVQGKDKYEVVIGLEVHAQLLTKSKLFSGDSATFGGEANTHISPITLAYPGTLPKLNKEAVELAIRLGLACGCEIERINYFARKNYFYPDLPKGYQISQHTTPICKGGFVNIRTGDGKRDVVLNRIHLEEDAGKSIHDVDDKNTCVDYNRAGVPLVEIVTEPDLHSSEEAYAYITELRKLVRYLHVCDGNMEEGSLRCDANISIRLKGETKLGTKVEVKNLNSIRNVKKAIDYEVDRMVELVEKGESITQETRSFDATNDTTFSLRSKEEANDYRYFPDPDLPPFIVSETQLQKIKDAMPALPEQLVNKYMEQLHLPEYDARVICDDSGTIQYFEKLIKHGSHAKPAANWLLGPVKSYLNDHNVIIEDFTLTPEKLADVIELVESGKVNFSIAAHRIFPALVKDGSKTALETATEMNLLQESDTDSIATWVDEVLAKMPDKVAEYKKGKKGLIGLFMGEVKKVSKGKADPKVTTQLLTEKLSQ